MSKFILRLSLFSLVVAIAAFCWNVFTPEHLHVKHIWLGLAVHVGITAAIFFRLAKAGSGDPKIFVRIFMGLTALKLFILLIVIVAYILLFRETAMGFSLAFLVLYLLFTAFETASLLRYFRKP